MVHIHSTIICLGGWNVAQYFDNAIMFDTETEIWSDAGVMKVPRGRPGASVVNLEDVIEYATDCETKELPIPGKDMQIGGALGVAISVRLSVCLSVYLSRC